MPQYNLACIQASESEALSSGHSSISTQAKVPHAARAPQVPLSPPLPTARLPPIKTVPKVRQPSAPVSAGVQQIPFMSQATAAQLQPSAPDEDVTPSPAKSASSVKMGDGSRGTESLPAAQSPHSDQAHVSETQVDCPEDKASKAVANNGKSPKAQEPSEGESEPAIPHQSPDASVAADPAPKDTAVAMVANEMPTTQESASPSKDMVVTGQMPGPTSERVQDPQGSSARSPLAQSAELVSAPQSLVRHAIPFTSHTTAQQSTVAVPVDIKNAQPDEQSSQAGTAAGLHGAASLPQPAAPPSSGQDALQPQASLPGDSHARAAAVAEAIKRAAQAIEPEQGATQGAVYI